MPHQRPDSLRQDTTPPAPPPRLPPWPAAPAPGWYRGVWEWDRDGLLRSGAFTLIELLEQVPGLTALRSGLFGQPEILSTPGAGPGRIEVRLDGFVLDQMRSPLYDLAGLDLLDMESVRVERWPDRVRIDLRTISPADRGSKTVIQAATGDQDTNLFRGSLRLPRILGGSLAAGLERLTTNGIPPTGPASRSTTWAKWTLATENAGMQLEARSTSTDRDGPEGASGLDRSDWVARIRRRLLTGLFAEGYLGATTVEDSLDAGRRRRSGIQTGLRLALDTGRIHLEAAGRHRTLEGLPGTALEVRGSAGPFAGLEVGGFGRREGWGDAGTTSSWGARAAVGPFLGLRAFAEATGGTVGAPFVSTTDGPLFHDSRAVRVGAEFSRWGIQLGGALARINADSVPGPGLAFDSLAALRAGPDNDVMELQVRIPTGWDPLWLEGSYTRVLDDARPFYVPDEVRRGAIVYHHVPLPSGNLEIYARLEHWRRGALLVPDGTGGSVTVPRNGQYDFYLQIRVVTLRAFLRWHNFTLRREQYDLPLHNLPIQRIYYGVKWTFTN